MRATSKLLYNWVVSNIRDDLCGFNPRLRSTLCKNYLGLKIFRLRFSFWAHMLLSWVSVIFQGTLKWKHPPLSSLVWVLNVDTEISSRIHVWDKAASSDCYVENNDNPYAYYDSTWSCVDIQQYTDFPDAQSGIPDAIS